MAILKHMVRIISQISAKSEKIHSDSKMEFEKMSAHGVEFEQQFRTTQSDIEQKRKAIQKIMR